MICVAQGRRAQVEFEVDPLEGHDLRLEIAARRDVALHDAGRRP